MEIPIGEGPDFRGIINLFSERAHIYRKGGARRASTTRPPCPRGASGDQFEEWENGAAGDAGHDQRRPPRALPRGREDQSGKRPSRPWPWASRSGDVVPLLCGSAEHSYGMQELLLKKIVELCPSPAETGGETRHTRAGMDEEVHLSPSDDETFSALHLQDGFRAPGG